MTLFVVLILARHSGSSHSATSGCLCLPAKQTLTVSHFLRQKAKSVPSGLTSPIRQPASLFSPALCPNASVPLWLFNWAGHNWREVCAKKKKLRKFADADRQLMTQDVPRSISRQMASGRNDCLQNQSPGCALTISIFFSHSVYFAVILYLRKRM